MAVVGGDQFGPAEGLESSFGDGEDEIAVVKLGMTDSGVGFDGTESAEDAAVGVTEIGEGVGGRWAEAAAGGVGEVASGGFDGSGVFHFDFRFFGFSVRPIFRVGPDFLRIF